jgi:hypothetical protein
LKEKESEMPIFYTLGEPYAWIVEGRKTIDIRKGSARRGNIAVFQSGASFLRLNIIRKETGRLTEIIREDNYKDIIPIAENPQTAVNYLIAIYGSIDGPFTAYYLDNSKSKK